jgi:hypothetical protein
MSKSEARLCTGWDDVRLEVGEAGPRLVDLRTGVTYPLTALLPAEMIPGAEVGSVGPPGSLSTVIVFAPVVEPEEKEKEKEEDGSGASSVEDSDSE